MRAIYTNNNDEPLIVATSGPLNVASEYTGQRISMRARNVLSSACERVTELLRTSTSVSWATRCRGRGARAGASGLRAASPGGGACGWPRLCLAAIQWSGRAPGRGEYPDNPGCSER